MFAIFSDNVIFAPEILATVTFAPASNTADTNTTSPTLTPDVFDI